jgi:hypothetical protein
LLATAFLSGCGTTYGTGQSSGMQMLADVGGIPKEKSEIDYRTRPPIVQPPAIGALPPPGSGNQSASNASWPVDPDEQARQIKTQQAANAASNKDDNYRPLNSKDPNMRLPADAVAAAPRQSNLRPSEAARGSRAEDERAKIAKAGLQASGSLDENGNPVRRYLIDPPAEYRVPDPDSPTTTEELEDCDPNKFRFPWQDEKPNEC